MIGKTEIYLCIESSLILQLLYRHVTDDELFHYLKLPVLYYNFSIIKAGVIAICSILYT